MEDEQETGGSHEAGKMGDGTSESLLDHGLSIVAPR